MEEHRPPPFSPSQIERLMRCPGSLQRCDGLPDDDSKEAERGTRIHQAIASQDPLQVPEADRWIVECALEYCAKLASQDRTALQFEVPLTLRDADGSLLTSGTAALVVIREGYDPAVIDWKSGRLPVSVEGNVQLKLYAAMILQKYPHAQNVIYGMLQPTVSTQAQLCILGRDYLKKAVSGVKTVVERAQDPSAKIVCGAWCRYCKASATCDLSLPLAIRASLSILDSEEPLLVQRALLVAERVERLLKGVQSRLTQIKSRAKFLMASGVTVPGFTLKSGNKIRVINDSYENQVCSLVKSFGISEEDWMRQCVTLSASRVIDLLSRAVDKQGRLHSGGRTLADSKKKIETLLCEFGALSYKVAETQIIPQIGSAK